MRGGGSGLNLNDSVYDRLLRERIIFLGSRSTTRSPTRSARSCCCSSAEDPERDINLYINSPGGSVTAGMAIFDTMQFIPNDIATFGDGPGGLDGAVPALRRRRRASATPSRTRGS